MSGGLQKWWPGTGSNRRRRPFQGRALPLSYLALAYKASLGQPRIHPSATSRSDPADIIRTTVRGSQSAIVRAAIHCPAAFPRVETSIATGAMDAKPRSYVL